MLRTSIILFTIIILATASQADDQSNWICMNGTQAQNPSENCENRDYQLFLEKEVSKAQKKLVENIYKATKILRDIEMLRRGIHLDHFEYERF